MTSYKKHDSENDFFRRGGSKSPPRSWRNYLVGKALPTDAEQHQTIPKKVGLAVFASDALSSTAYATQEILFILAAAGTAAFVYSFPIAICIVLLLAIVTISYEQTIHAYPSGGGAYIVARDNLGGMPAQLAGASILTDYILTVAVSISAGVAQISSAFPDVYPYRVLLAVCMVALIAIINLRGIKESGIAFAIPTYFFLVMMFGMIVYGMVKVWMGDLNPVIDPPALLAHSVAPLSLFLLFHAFSSGTTALTGIEAISDGIPNFKEPKSRNAGITLLWMSTILATLFLGITYLAQYIHAIPSEHETVISQLARTIYDAQGMLYLATLASTAVILIMAANTAFADFPRLGAIIAADGYLPRQLTYRGSRLVFSRGILTLSFLACALIIIFSASVTSLIPLYAIGVFFSFTLSQMGMARRWWKCGLLKKDEVLQERGSVVRHDSKWRYKLAINSFGAVCTAIVMLMFAVTKFMQGAWIVLIVIPFMVFVFSTIHRHYQRLAACLALQHSKTPARINRHRVILLVSGVHCGTVTALQYARQLSSDITAVHVSTSPTDAERVKGSWQEWGDGVRLVMLESPYRRLLEPLIDYIEDLDSKRQPNEIITVVVPNFVPREFWRSLLHTHTAFFLRRELMFHPGIVITEVPYIVD